MSAQDQVYLNEAGDRVELLVEPGVIHVVEMPYRQPARRIPKPGFEDPTRMGRAYVAKGYRPVREQPVARVLVDIAPDAVHRVQRGAFGSDEWAGRLAKRTFYASLDAPLTRREAWALARYLRLRHARALVLDAYGPSPAPRSAPRHREPLRAWLEALVHDGETPFEELVFRGCRFHRDDAARLAGIVPGLSAVGFVAGLPRRLDAFAHVERLTLGCRVPEGLIPVSAFEALGASGVDPVSLSVELGRDQLAPQKTAEALLAWLHGTPARRLRSVSLAGCPLTTVLAFNRGPLRLERVHWEGRVTSASLEAVLAEALPFELSIGVRPGSDRGLGVGLPTRVSLESTGHRVCPFG